MRPGEPEPTSGSEHELDPVPSYAAFWRRLRKWQIAFALVLIGFLPSTACVGLWLEPRTGHAFASALLLVHWTAMIVCFAKSQLFACPRCDHGFTNTGNFNPFARECRFCGLPRWSLRDPDRPRVIESPYR
jgi:hypothetical protein